MQDFVSYKYKTLPSDLVYFSHKVLVPKQKNAYSYPHVFIVQIRDFYSLQKYIMYPSIRIIYH